MQKLLLFFFIPCTLLAQQPCKAILEKYIDKSDRYHYQPRSGGYCEGTVARKPVSGQRFEVKAVLKGSLRFNSKKDREVKITVPSSQKGVIIQAQDKRYTYRLDAQLAGTETFYWKINEVVIPNNYSPYELFIFGYVGPEEKRLYVPLQLSTASFPNLSKLVTVYMLADEELENIAWRYVRCVNGVSKGAVSNWIQVNNSAGSDLNTPIAVELNFPSSPQPGEYCIDIMGVVSTDSTNSKRVESLRIWID
ncbi:hypothetical protein GCM10028803_46310 [Larkinella knui]|uniref:Uncharacterized protein n=1 Tax=Larkinella knui TaxID=2025310 RepID=A0A3P1CPI5_9BACT|nr:hypothetical protein [Larkinella knui]RRB15227.1 hypothetical protein EHT87_11835 [Larkinella knui]